MADEENAQLRKEIDRQNQVIDVLLDSNKQLKQALAFYQQIFNQPENSIYANDNNKVGIMKTQDAIAKIMNGVNKSQNEVATIIIGVNNSNYANDKNKDDVIKTQDKIAEIKDGVINKKEEIAENIAGVNQDSSLPPAKETTIHPPQTDLAELYKLARQPVSGLNYGGKDVITRMITMQDIAEGKTPVLYNNLYALLRKTIVRATESGLVNTAQILMKLHESPQQSLKSLQKLTLLSEDGITKRIMSMKKFGLIVRASGRRLMLTEKAKQLIEKARM